MSIFDLPKLLLGLAILGSNVCTAWAQETRVALVIGNSAYERVPTLANPENDATDIAAALTRNGFDVTLAVDASDVEMRSLLKEFARSSATSDLSLVYFAGHGIEVDKTNYLIPVNASLSNETDVGFEALPLDLVMQTLSVTEGIKIVIVDACRNNPFAEKLRETTGTRSVGKGLARVDPVGGVQVGGILVGYAAREGTVAYDGAGRNSPYATAILENLEAPGLEVSKFFRVVRDRVFELTGGQQEPFTYGALPGADIFLASPDSTETPDLSGQSLIEAFAEADLLDTGEGWEDFLSEFGDSADNYLVELATTRLEELRREERVRALRENRQPWLETSAAMPLSGKVELNQAERKLVQKSLQYAGFDPGPADGDFGPRTLRAIQSARQQFRLPSGTLVDAALLNNLPNVIEIDKLRSGTAREVRYTDLPLHSEARLAKALQVLEGHELIFGYFEGRLYIAVLSRSGGWGNSQRMALRAGGHLVTITSDRENRFVFELFSEDIRFYTQGPHNVVDGPNIGLYKPDVGSESEWHWVSGEPVTYRNFLSSNPDQYRYARFFGEGTPENLRRRPNKWRDHPGLDGSFVMEIQ